MGDFVYTVIGWVAAGMLLTIGGLFLAYKRSLGKAISDTTKQTLDALQRIALYDPQNGDLLSKFIEHESHSNTRTFSFDEKMGKGNLLYEAFLDQLGSTFDKIEKVQEKGNDDFSTLIYKVTNGEAGVAYLRLSVKSSMMYSQNDKLKPYYTSENYQLGHYTYKENASGNDILPVVTFVQMIIPVENNDEKILTIDELIDVCMLKSVHYDHVGSSLSSVGKLAFGSRGEMYIENYPVLTSKTFISNEEADLMYSDVDIQYNGKEYPKKPSQMLAILEAGAEEGTNIQLYGKFGTGKTKIAYHLATRLAQKHSNEVIFISPSALRELDNIRMQSAFTQMIRQRIQENENKRFYLFIDEAETALRSDNGFHTKENAFLLQLMDGVEKDFLNMSVILTFNADPKDLNQALFRSGRAGIIVNMTPITAERAEALVAYLKTTDKMKNKIFQPAALAKFLNEDSATVNGTVYAPKGFTTIADVLQCFASKKFDRVMSMLEGKPVEVTPATPVVPQPAPKASNRPTPPVAVQAIPEKITIRPEASKNNNRKGSRPRGNR